MSYAYWRADATTDTCELCFERFTFTKRRHHCRDCGGIFCDSCTTTKLPVHHRGFKSAVRICKLCAPYVMKRLAVATAATPAASPTNASIILPREMMSRRRLLGPDETVAVGHALSRLREEYINGFSAAAINPDLDGWNTPVEKLSVFLPGPTDLRDVLAFPVPSGTDKELVPHLSDPPKAGNMDSIQRLRQMVEMTRKVVESSSTVVHPEIIRVPQLL